MTIKDGFLPRYFAGCLFVLGTLLSSGAEAATSPAASSNFNSQTQLNTALNPRDSHDDSWKFTVAPYLWALNLNGSVQVRGQRAPVSENFGDILSDLNWAGMLWLEADKGKWGVFGNLLYASLSQGASDRYISAHVNVNFQLYSAGLSYELYRACLCSSGCGQPGDSTLAIVPYIGARYTAADTQLKVNTPFGNIRGSNNKSWTDPIIGARFNFDLTKSWQLTFAGDVGGTNVTSDYSYNVMGLIGFKPQTILKSTTWYLGYRLLDQKYTYGASSNYFMWDMKLKGPMAGVAFTF
jgi:hypothetical protein